MNELTTIRNFAPAFFSARRALEKARTVDEAKGVRDKAEAFRAYAIKARDREMELLASEIRMRAERRAGEMLLESARNKTRRGRGKVNVPAGNILPTLKEMGITAKESLSWQRIAKLKEAEFEARIKRMRETGARLTSSSFLNAAFSSKTDQHLSPKEVLALVYKVLGRVDLDPCAETVSSDSRDWDRHNVRASRYFDKRDDGLKQEWKGRVYMNPPYGDEVMAWVLKLVDSYRTGAVHEAIALLAARTDTAWFAELGRFPACFVSGRLIFVGSTAGAPFPSAAIYLGDRPRRFCDEFSKLGPVYARIRAMRRNG